MTSKKHEFIEFLLDTQCLRFGNFTLKSGDSSPFFINLGHVIKGDQLDFLGKHLAEVIYENYPETNVLFGPAYKGISLVTACAIACAYHMEKNPGICYNRKEQKKHGEGGMFIGYQPTSVDKLIIIDDVLSSGGTKVEAVNTLKSSFGVKVQGIIVAVDRRHKEHELEAGLPPVHSVVNIMDIYDYLNARNDAHARLVHNFYHGFT